MFKQAILESKYCKEKGYFIQHIETLEIDEENYLDYSVPFLFGFVNQSNKAEFLVPTIRTVGNEFVIHTYRNLDYKTDDIIAFDTRFYHIKDINVSYENDGFNRIKHYFITLK